MSELTKSSVATKQVKTNKDKEVNHEKSLFCAAQKLTEWDGWIYWDNSPRDVEDFSSEWAKEGYWESVEDLLASITAYNDECEDSEEKVEVPLYVWCCRDLRLANTDVSNLFAERLKERTYEDAWDHVSKAAISELQSALDKFYAVTDKIVGYLPDYSKALLLTPNN